ncbi:relaxase/mobilization nuclease domain-containing protein [Brevundimonas naejangsanensis]|uniref:relaxase/mobilization nuclease domain-containing protein n=1 Tax=Brevundimonas naejangsanensis TaxID=588932 RepID=UPI0039F6C313
MHEISGFIASDVLGAMKEIQAVAAGTRCKQPLFSVSLNPPETETVPVAAFEGAIDRIEKANGFEGQPRIVVFHEKEGRRHAHVLWSCIDAATMTAKAITVLQDAPARSLQAALSRSRLADACRADGFQSPRPQEF